MIDSKMLIKNLLNFGFHIIDDFLSPDICHELRSTAEGLYSKGFYRGAKIGLNVASIQDKTIRTDEIFWLDEHEANPAIQNFLGKTNQLAQLVNKSLFLGIQEFETHFASYQPGTYYKKHIDQFATKKSRIISCVYYLNKNWQPEYGGELKLYDKEDQLLRTVLPEENRFICFNSDLPHEVCVTHQPRFSITGWMKTRSMSFVL